MQHKMTVAPESPIFSISSIFESPGRYVVQLQASSPKTWITAATAAMLGYALFGLSIALSPHASMPIAAIWTVPLIFFLAQLVSLPALYIFHAFFGSRLSPQEVAATGLVALLVPATLLAGLAPINWFMLASVKHPEQLLWVQKTALLGAAVLGYIELLNTLPNVEQTAPVQPACHLAARTKLGRAPVSKAEVKRRQLLLVWFFLYLGVLYKLMKLLTQTHG